MFIKDRTMLAQKFEWITQIRKWIENTDQTVIVELQGGEPFASILYQDLIASYLDLPNVRFVIKTNGTLIRNNHAVIAQLLPKLSSMNVSIDAATPTTYEQKVRLGARWSHLIEGLEFLSTLNIPVGGNFVIQQDNLNEVLPFVDFCEQYNLGPAFLVLQDWGTWHDFESHCVHLPTSTNYAEFVSIVKTLDADPRVDASGLLNWITRA
jgi:MoaA/NifB/PqqE/SkfB family radical SAM enzyme